MKLVLILCDTLLLLKCWLKRLKTCIPNAKLAIGPTIENGFYYDVLFENPISIEDFPVIEKEMKKIIKTGRKIEKIIEVKERGNINIR